MSDLPVSCRISRQDHRLLLLHCFRISPSTLAAGLPDENDPRRLLVAIVHDAAWRDGRWATVFEEVALQPSTGWDVPLRRMDHPLTHAPVAVVKYGESLELPEHSRPVQPHEAEWASTLELDTYYSPEVLSAELDRRLKSTAGPSP